MYKKQNKEKVKVFYANCIVCINCLFVVVVVVVVVVATMVKVKKN